MPIKQVIFCLSKKFPTYKPKNLPLKQLIFLVKFPCHQFKTKKFAFLAGYFSILEIFCVLFKHFKVKKFAVKAANFLLLAK